MNLARDCRTFRDRLPLLVGGDLMAAEAREAWAHVGTCVLCRGELTALSSARNALASLRADLDREHPLADPPARILERIPEPVLAADRGGWRRWGTAAAAAVLLVGFALGLRHRGSIDPAPLRYEPSGLGLEVSELSGGYLADFPATRPVGLSGQDAGALSRPLYRSHAAAADWLAVESAGQVPTPAYRGRGALQGLLAQQAAIGSFSEQEQRLLSEVLGADPIGSSGR